MGMNLEEMTLLARCNGLHTLTFRASKHSDHETIMRAKKINYIDQTILDHTHSHHNQSRTGCQSKSCNTKKCESDAVDCQQPFVNYFDLSLFRTMVQACSRIPEMYSIVNFGRQELEQTGTGHFACLGGYHPETDKVLVMDTARFKYPPFWVDLEFLYNSIRSVDQDTNKMRGFIVVSRYKCKAEV